MDTYFPTTILLLLEGFRQHFPARHFAYVQGDVWALAMLGTPRTCVTNIARTCVFVERHLASWERFLAEAQWDLRGVSQTVVTQLLQQLGRRLYLWEALLAAVDTTLIPQVRGKMPGVQKWHDHSGDPARGESLVGHHWALIGKEERLQVVWPDVWLRDVRHKVRVVVVATKREPILLVSTDRTLPPEVISPLYAARFPLELSLRDLKQYWGLGDYQCYTLLAIHRFVHLALAACCLWRLTLLQDRQAAWLGAEPMSPAGQLTPLSCPRLHRALRRRVLQRIFALSAPGADSQKTEASDEQIFRIAA